MNQMLQEYLIIFTILSTLAFKVSFCFSKRNRYTTWRNLHRESPLLPTCLPCSVPPPHTLLQPRASRRGKDFVDVLWIMRRMAKGHRSLGENSPYSVAQENAHLVADIGVFNYYYAGVVRGTAYTFFSGKMFW